MNLYDTLYTWTTKALFEYKTTWTEIKPLKSAPTMQRLSWHDALHASQTLLEKETLQQETKKQQVTVIAPVSLRYDDEKGIFRYQVRTDRDIQNRRGVTELVIDAYTGELRLFLLPTGQYTGNTISNWLYALHMANVFGMAWKILVCLLGILIAGLSVTGVLIWWRKRIRSR